MSENAEDTSSNALVVISSEYTSTTIGLSKNASTGINDNTPRIICNELLVSPHKSKSVEKLDELSSLELEIAKMHQLDDTNMDIDEKLLSSSSHVMEAADNVKIVSGNAESDLSNGQKASNILRRQESNIDDKLDVITSGETALEHEDLIAVLKGLDGAVDDSDNNHPGISVLEEGVTIEGEGEYQIMEVIDEDSNTGDDATKPDGNIVAQTLNKTKTFGSTSLTAQEERALALEQIECLKNSINHQRRRKQDIKPIKQVDPALDIVSTLEADWSEQEEDGVIEKNKNESKTKLQTMSMKSCQSTNDKSNSPLITNVVVIPSITTTSSNVTNTTSPLPNINNSDSGGTIEEKNDSLHDGIIETKTEEDTQVVPSQTGFRRTRIIKRKIIWDPDAPETTFSYAKLVKSNNAKAKPKNNTIPSTTITKGSTTITPIKKEQSTSLTTTTKKPQRPVTPKVKKLPEDLNIDKTNSENTHNATLTKVGGEITGGKTNSKHEENLGESVVNLDKKVSVSTKKRSQTPVSNSPGVGVGLKKKKNSELDRLMGDEGAINMLNSLEKLEASIGSSETKTTRPMMRSRAATICEKLPRKETSSPARTSSPAGSNQQSNKNKRTPKSRASSTWDYVYKKKKQDFDDSLIIRRRSNSSYSSTTSQNRLSLDGQPQSVITTNTTESSRSSNSKTLPASTSENDLSKIHSTSSHNKSSGSTKSNTTTPPAGKSFEFAKPEIKKSQKRTKSPAATLPNDMKKAASVASRRNVRSPAVSNEDKDNAKSSIKSDTTSSNLKERKEVPSSPSIISDVVVKKSSKVAQILFSTNKAKLNNTFTIQMLNKLVDILDKLASDSDCHVIVIGTNDAHFCQGIDITDLTMIAIEKRRSYAVNLATSVKKYLKTLATYPKPLIAGVSGNLMNLGVIQLALFDIVIASDKSTFETPYAKMGQVPEGYCIWHNMNKIRGSFKTKLFWLCEKIQSTEAALAGLVNKLTSGNKVNDDALNTAKRIASLSAQSYSVMKKTVINNHMDVIVSSLDEEFDTIIKQWTSSECLENIKKYIEQGHI